MQAKAVALLITATLGYVTGSDDHESRIKSLERRVASLEKHHQPTPGSPATQSAASSVVDIALTRKEAQRENPSLDFYNIIFDVEFTGSSTLGSKRIKDIKGTIFFDDAFGEAIIGAGTTQRLNIGAGGKKVIRGLKIEFTKVGVSDGWKRVLTTDKEELSVRFVVDKVIYEGE